MNWLAIFIGGGLGSLSRFGISKLVLSFSAPVFPWATLIANVLSCVILVLGLNYLNSRDLLTWEKYFLVVGFCGGFSTFSTFAYETFELMKSNHYLFAILNIIISVLLCLFVFWALYKNFSHN